ncbi:DUF551 domain-containing protein [Escherichia coli]
MITITNKKQYPSEQYLNELITNIEFAARAPVEVVRAMAAELQKRREADSAEPVSQTYKLPVNTPCQDAPAHIWLQTAGVWPEDGELSELTWCSHNQHHDDTLYVRADLVNGNYPATPDSWISCSERMPEDTKMLLAFSQGQIVAAYWNWVMSPIDYKKYRAFTYLSGNILDDVTHWMPLPEPPQQDGE